MVGIQICDLWNPLPSCREATLDGDAAAREFGRALRDEAADLVREAYQRLRLTNGG